MLISKLFIRLSIAAGLLSAFVSLKGIVGSDTYIKETINWAAQAVGQDYVNLFIVFPALMISSYFLARNSVKALLLWLGILLYLIYSYILYAFFIHFGPLFLAYVAILGLSFYSFVGSLITLDWKKVSSLFEKVNVKSASIMLTIIGAMFYLLWLSDITRALIMGKLPQDLDKIGLLVNPIQVLDMALLLPGALIVSFLLRKKSNLGLVLAVPLLIFFLIMGIAIIAMMILLSQKGFPLAYPQIILMVVIILVCAKITFDFFKNLMTEKSN